MSGIRVTDAAPGKLDALPGQTAAAVVAGSAQEHITNLYSLGKNMKFKGKTIVITGAASGIGRAAALRFAAEGATVIAADINEAGGRAIVEEAHGDVRFKRCDVTNVADIEALMAYAAQSTGGIDVLFNNAGAPSAKERIDDLTADKWDTAMNLLLRSVAMGIVYAVPHMKGRVGASIINMSSVAAVRTGMGTTVYGVAKAGVLQLTKMAAADLARHGIRVNSISPGLINTNLFASVLKLPADKFEPLKSKFAEVSAHAQPVPRAGQPEDIAAMALFLASEDGSFITGSDMLVDGGITLGERRSWDPECPGLFDDLLATLK